MFPLVSEAYINSTGSVSRPGNSFLHWHLSLPVALVKFFVQLCDETDQGSDPG